MYFSTDISEIMHDVKVKLPIGGEFSLQSPQDVFFRSKQWEICEQYQMARMYLINADIGNYKEWLGFDDEEINIDLQVKYQASMFEAALIFYNTLIDLSWVLCYGSAESTLFANGEPVGNLSDVMNIENAYELYRKLESCVTEPDNTLNPLKYISYKCKDFSPSIEYVMEFWKKVCNEPTFSDGSTVRSLYNFVKHRGKPLYTEFEQLMGQKLMGLYIGDKKCPSDIRDLQKKLDLNDSIQKLKLFDDLSLFPYMKGLIQSLETSLKPSSFI